MREKGPRLEVPIGGVEENLGRRLVKLEQLAAGSACRDLAN